MEGIYLFFIFLSEGSFSSYFGTFFAPNRPQIVLAISTPRGEVLVEILENFFCFKRRLDIYFFEWVGVQGAPGAVTRAQLEYDDEGHKHLMIPHKMSFPCDRRQYQKWLLQKNASTFAEQVVESVSYQEITVPRAFIARIVFTTLDTSLNS